MSDFRKNMYLSFKQKTADIIYQFFCHAGDDGDAAFEPTPIEYIAKWVDKNCLPMGDFDKERAMKKLEEWSE